MEDSRIIALYWQKNAEAIQETNSKYGAYCFAIADNILRSREDAEVLLTHMELTNTGIRFRYDTQGGAIDLKAQFSVLLKSGADISYSEGSSVPMSDQTTMNCSYHWEIPVELEEVAAVQIGSTTIPVP